MGGVVVSKELIPVDHPHICMPLIYYLLDGTKLVFSLHLHYFVKSPTHYDMVHDNNNSNNVRHKLKKSKREVREKFICSAAKLTKISRRKKLDKQNKSFV